MDTPQLIQLLERQGTKSTLSRGQNIDMASHFSSFILIESGYVKRCLTRTDGSISIQSIYGPGDFFPLSAVFEHLFDYELASGELSFLYECMTPVEIFSISMEELKSAISVQKECVLYKELLMVAGRRLEFNIHYLNNEALGDSYQRIAHHLVFLSTLYSSGTDEVYKISLPFQSQDLADMLNVSKETANKHLANMEHLGLLENIGNYININNLSGLKKVYS
jgi:CRP-like cAMP-binding protein